MLSDQLNVFLFCFCGRKTFNLYERVVFKCASQVVFFYIFKRNKFAFVIALFVVGIKQKLNVLW